MAKRKRSQRREQASKRAKYPTTLREHYRISKGSRVTDEDEVSGLYSAYQRESNRYR